VRFVRDGSLPPATGSAQEPSFDTLPPTVMAAPQLSPPEAPRNTLLATVAPAPSTPPPWLSTNVLALTDSGKLGLPATVPPAAIALLSTKVLFTTDRPPFGRVEGAPEAVHRLVPRERGVLDGCRPAPDEDPVPVGVGPPEGQVAQDVGRAG
jgi:hypothetical protein